MKTKTTFKLALMIMGFTALASPAKAQQNSLSEVVVAGYPSREVDLSELSKMDKDIHILENVLDEIFSDGRASFFGSRGAKGVNIPSTGVIFNVNSNMLFGSGYTTYNDVVFAQGFKKSVEITDKNKEVTEEDMNKLNEEKEAKIADLAKNFLANYGSLLTELSDSEKVQVSCEYTLHVKSENTKINGAYAIISSSRGDNKRRLSVMATYKDLKDFASGKINESSIMSKIKVTKSGTDEKGMLDAKILAGIFDDLFSSSISNAFTRSGSTSWTYFEGFGVMYNLNLSSRNARSVFYLRDSGTGAVGVGKDDKTEEELNKEMEEAYPQLEDILKENLVKYGRTLRSLGDDEVIIMNVNLNGISRNSKVPRSIRMVVSKKTIDAFSSGQRSLEQVKEQIDIKKLASNTSIPGFTTIGSDLYYSVAPASGATSTTIINGKAVHGTGAISISSDNN